MIAEQRASEPGPVEAEPWISSVLAGNVASNAQDSCCIPGINKRRVQCPRMKENNRRARRRAKKRSEETDSKERLW